MKGTPDAPQCGFSRAVCQILDVQVSRICLFRIRLFALADVRSHPVT
jgi:glutaredoxin-related protein